jgi:hypothetical protein
VLGHRAFERDGARHKHRGIDVVAFAMTGRALDDRLGFRHAGGLAVLRVGVVFGVQRDHRAARAVGGKKARGETREAARHLEFLRFERIGHQLRAFVLLHAEFGEVEYRIADQADRARVAVEEIENESLGIGNVGRGHDALRGRGFSEIGKRA